MDNNILTEIDPIDHEWVAQKMKQHGLKSVDLCRETTIEKSNMSLLLSGTRKMNKSVKAMFYYYFRYLELKK